MGFHIRHLTIGLTINLIMIFGTYMVFDSRTLSLIFLPFIFVALQLYIYKTLIYRYIRKQLESPQLMNEKVIQNVNSLIKNPYQNNPVSLPAHLVTFFLSMTMGCLLIYSMTIKGTMAFTLILAFVGAGVFQVTYLLSVYKRDVFRLLSSKEKKY